jgi:hypothetical protein
MCFHQLLAEWNTRCVPRSARGGLAPEIQTVPKDGCRFLMRQIPSKDGVCPNVGEKSKVFGIGNVGPNEGRSKSSKYFRRQEYHSWRLSSATPERSIAVRKRQSDASQNGLHLPYTERNKCGFEVSFTWHERIKCYLCDQTS